MTETALAALLSVSILGALALWVPFLDRCHSCLHRLNLLTPRAHTLHSYDDDLEAERMDRAA